MNERKTISLPADVAGLVPDGVNVSAWVSWAIRLRSAVDAAVPAATVRDRAVYVAALVEGRNLAVERAIRLLRARKVGDGLRRELAGLADAGGPEAFESLRVTSSAELATLLAEEEAMGRMGITTEPVEADHDAS